jgi:hypothetical protein
MNLQNKGLSLFLTQITLHLIREGAWTWHLIASKSIKVKIIIKVMSQCRSSKMPFLLLTEHILWEISKMI